MKFFNRKPKVEPVEDQKARKDPRLPYRMDLDSCKATSSVCAFHDVGVVTTGYTYVDKSICHACMFGNLSYDINSIMKHKHGIADDNLLLEGVRYGREKQDGE